MPRSVGVPLALRLGRGVRLDPLLRRRLVGVDLLLAEVGVDQAVGVAAQQDVDAATGHVGGDGHRAGPTRLRDDERLALVLLGVEHFVGHAPPFEQLVQSL